MGPLKGLTFKSFGGLPPSLPQFPPGALKWAPETHAAMLHVLDSGTLLIFETKCGPSSKLIENPWCRWYHEPFINPKKTGGPKRPPPLRHFAWLLRNAKCSHRGALWPFFSGFPHILTPNLWHPGVRFSSYVTFYTCTSDRKWLKFVILCANPLQICFRVKLILITLFQL